MKQQFATGQTVLIKLDTTDGVHDVIRPVWVQGTIIDADDRHYNVMYVNPLNGVVCRKIFTVDQIWPL